MKTCPQCQEPMFDDMDCCFACCNPSQDQISDLVESGLDSNFPYGEAPACKATPPIIKTESSACKFASPARAGLSGGSASAQDILDLMGLLKTGSVKEISLKLT